MTYRILSLDGGGIYGTHQAVIIRRLCESHPQLLTNTDLFAGSSIGGIIAIGLAMGHSADMVVDFFRKSPNTVLKESWWRHLAGRLGLLARHDNSGLRAVLTTAYGPNTTLRDLPKKVVVPAFKLDGPYGWEAKLFHNMNRLAGTPAGVKQSPSECLEYDGELLAVDVAMASAAAPVYFPTVNGFVDGGLVANNPASLAVCKAIHAGVASLADVHVLALGAHNTTDRLPVSNADLGFWSWFRPLLRILFSLGSLTTDFECRQLLGDRYCRLYTLLPYRLQRSMDDPGLVPDLLEHAETVNLDSTRRWLDRNWSA